MLILLALVIGMLGHHSTSVILAITRLAALVLVSLAVVVFYSQSSRNYSRLNRAKVDGNWKEVLECVERLRRSRQTTRIGVADLELAYNRALALAHLGELDRALAEFNETAQNAALPTWLVCSRLAALYEAGHQYEKAVELRTQMVCEKPDMAAGWVDLANTLARRLNRPTEARRALVRAENMELTALEKTYVCYVNGVMFWREARYLEAKDKLETALNRLKPLAAKPLIGGVMMQVKSYLAVVNGELGNTVEARALFREARKYLEAHQEDELLRACQKIR